MPIYTLYCNECEAEKIKILPIAQRDEPQPCEDCDNAMSRKIDRPGLVWSPTANGGYS